MSELVLEAGRDALVIERHEPAWCRVWLRRNGVAQRFLGAESWAFLRARLAASLTAPRAGEPRFVLSLAEAHHTLRMRGDDGAISIDVEDAQGAPVGSLTASEAERRVWLARLETP